MMKIRTRYAPSPTGYFHVGGARTALFNYLFAKHNHGDFIVRIEDTDIERNVPNGIESQLNNLAWLGLKVDESVYNPGKYGPYIQTQKLQRYQELANQLLKKDLAYYCFCSKEDLEKNRQECMKKGLTPKYNRACLHLTKQEIEKKLASKCPYVIRLKITKEKYEWNDLIRGLISVPSDALTDPVILKSNGIPMYNFAVVVDDYDMQITHVIRGEEHISNTPYQIAIKEALGFDKQDIQYGHLSVIVNKDGKKLSKRDQSLKQFIQDYLQMGFYPAAIINFLALLGWSPSDNQEVMTLDQMTTKFDIHHVSKAPTFFDYEKMMWFSNKYFIKLSDQEYLDFVGQYLTLDLDYLINRKQDILLLFKKQISYAAQLNDLIKETFFDYDLDRVFKNFGQFLKQENCQKTISCLVQEIKKAQKMDFDSAKELINRIKVSAGTNGMELFMPIRLVLTSQEHGPELYKILAILPSDEIAKRMEKFLAKYESTK